MDETLLKLGREIGGFEVRLKALESLAPTLAKLEEIGHRADRMLLQHQEAIQANARDELGKAANGLLQTCDVKVVQRIAAMQTALRKEFHEIVANIHTQFGATANNVEAWVAKRQKHDEDVDSTIVSLIARVTAVEESVAELRASIATLLNAFGQVATIMNKPAQDIPNGKPAESKRPRRRTKTS